MFGRKEWIESRPVVKGEPVALAGRGLDLELTLQATGVVAPRAASVVRGG